jgi:hypothetical protein
VQYAQNCDLAFVERYAFVLILLLVDLIHSFLCYISSLVYEFVCCISSLLYEFMEKDLRRG